MKKYLACAMVSCCVVVLILAGTVSAGGEKADPAAQKIFDKMLGAIQANDREAFRANATDVVKEGTTQAVMDALNKAVGARLKQGYKASYLCQLKQLGHQVHLWKLTFKDDGDDLVIRVALKDGKVGGFFLQ